MSKVIDNLITEGLSGKIQRNKMYTFRQYLKNTYLYCSRKSLKPATSSQSNVRTRFTTAHANALVRYHDASQHAADVTAFRSQKKCKTLLGFLTQSEYKKLVAAGN